MLILTKLLTVFKCACQNVLHVWAPHMCWYLQGPEENIKFPGIGIREVVSCLIYGWGIKTSSSEREANAHRHRAITPASYLKSRSKILKLNNWKAVQQRDVHILYWDINSLYPNYIVQYCFQMILTP